MTTNAPDPTPSTVPQERSAQQQLLASANAAIHGFLARYDRDVPLTADERAELGALNDAFSELINEVVTYDPAYQSD